MIVGLPLNIPLDQTNVKYSAYYMYVCKQATERSSVFMVLG